MKERRPTRSDKYQHLLLETSCSNDMMEGFSNSDSISDRLNPFAYNDELFDLKDQLKVEFWRIVEQLTPRQKEVLKLYAKDQNTQQEIASILGINQSSITKSINGNCDYSDKGGKGGGKGGKKRVYGGSTKKLQKIIETDDRIQKILKRMGELLEPKW
jgi:predicted transcriptional regulator